jgi:hypothetical protein
MTTQTELFGPAPAQRHSATSLAAAKSVEPNANTDRRRILLAIRDAGVRGLTDEELQFGLNLPGDTERPRRNELLEKGLIWKSATTRPTRSGHEATVWRSS